MNYTKPQVTIDLEEYNELLTRSKVGLEYTEKNHLVNSPNDLLDYLKFNINPININRVDRIQFRVQHTDNSITIINNNSWLKTVELLEWIKQFKNLDVHNIKELRIGYISGLQSPVTNNVKGLAIAHAGDYYEAHCKIKY